MRHDGTWWFAKLWSSSIPPCRISEADEFQDLKLQETSDQT